MIAFFLGLALAAPPQTLTYTRPDNAAADDLAAHQFTRWEVKARLYTALPDVGVFDGSGLKRISVLAMGEQVRIEEVGAVANVNDRVDAWYRVEAGWVFGGDLTPFRWEADMDGDGEKEVVTLAWLDNFTVRMRVLEPNLRAGAVMQIDVEPAGNAYVAQQGAILTAELISAKEAGIALVHVHLGVEACADYRDDWIGYQSPGPVKIGFARVALSLAGLIDPPNESTFEVVFSGKRQTAFVTRSTVEVEGQDPVEMTDRYVLRNGVFLLERDGEVSR